MIDSRKILQRLNLTSQQIEEILESEVIVIDKKGEIASWGSKRKFDLRKHINNQKGGEEHAES